MHGFEQKQTVWTYIDHHLGDNLIHANFLLKACAKNPNTHFVHFAQPQYIPQLLEIVDGANITLGELSQRPATAVDAWKNRNGGFYPHPKRDDWVAFHLYFFERLSADMGIENPICEPCDFLMDYPRLTEKDYDPVDCIFIDGAALSGQLRMEKRDIDMLANLIRDKHSVVTTSETQARGISVSDLGSMSRHCKYIVGVATGPMWTMLNVHNDDKLKLFLLDREHVDISPNTHHASSLAGALNVLKRAGVL